jgi:hypothetical protein
MRPVSDATLPMLPTDIPEEQLKGLLNARLE